MIEALEMLLKQDLESKLNEISQVEMNKAKRIATIVEYIMNSYIWLLF